MKIRKYKLVVLVFGILFLMSTVTIGCSKTDSNSNNASVSGENQDNNQDENQGENQGENQDENQGDNQDEGQNEPGDIIIGGDENDENDQPHYLPVEYSFSEEEMNRMATENRNKILENPNTLVEISQSVSGYAIEAFLDFDGDGVAEKMQMTYYMAGQPVPYSWEDRLLYRVYLWLDYSNSLLRSTYDSTIWGYSPDGENIFLVLYDPGMSDDPETTLYLCDKGEETGSLTRCFAFEQDMRECELKDGTIRANVRIGVVENDCVNITYEYSGDNTFVQREEIYESSNTEHYIDLLVELQLKPELDSQETITVTPQKVKVMAYSADFTWVLIEAEDGTTGWFEVDMGVVTQNGKYTWDIFDGLSNAG